MAVLANSDPPSSGSFNSGFGDTMKALLQFQKATGSPFMINPYPFFAYQSDPRPETLAFCLFQPNAGRVDSASGIKYMNMFDAQVSIMEPNCSCFMQCPQYQTLIYNFCFVKTLINNFKSIVSGCTFHISNILTDVKVRCIKNTVIFLHLYLAKNKKNIFPHLPSKSNGILGFSLCSLN